MQCCQKAALRAIAKSFVTTAALLLLLAACTPILRSHGYAPAEQDLASLRVGVDTRRSVAEAVGTPTLSGVQDEGSWYYVSSIVREFAYRRPEIIERELVAISFDRNGVVTNIERFGLRDGRVIVLNRRVTGTAVETPGIIRQILGNIGRVGAEDVVGDR